MQTKGVGRRQKRQQERQIRNRRTHKLTDAEWRQTDRQIIKGQKDRQTSRGEV